MTIAVALFIAGGLVGTAITYFLVGRTAPAEFRQACRMFVAAHQDAQNRADSENDESIADEPAHPTGPEDTWTTQNQADLEEAAVLARRAATNESRRSGDPYSDWWSVANALAAAAKAMNPDNQGRDDIDTSRVGRQVALNEALIGCVGH